MSKEIKVDIFWVLWSAGFLIFDFSIGFDFWGWILAVILAFWVFALGVDVGKEYL